MVGDDQHDRNRTEHGNYANEYPLDRFLDVFDSPEPLTSREVADEIGCTRKTAFSKLTALDDAGELEAKQIAGRIWIWWSE